VAGPAGAGSAGRLPLGVVQTVVTGNIRPVAVAKLTAST
jgi:hypothetical protein